MDMLGVQGYDARSSATDMSVATVRTVMLGLAAGYDRFDAGFMLAVGRGYDRYAGYMLGLATDMLGITHIL